MTTKLNENMTEAIALVCLILGTAYATIVFLCQPRS